MLLFHVNHIGLAIISGCLVIESRVDGHTEVWLAGARIEILKHAEVLPTGRYPTQGYSGGGDPKNTVSDRIKDGGSLLPRALQKLIAMSSHRDRYGGKVAQHYKFWTTFCNDGTVLKHVGGISIPLVKKVNQTAPVREIHMNERERKFVRQKLQQLIDCGCIVKLNKPIKNGWLSNIFLRPKKDGTYHVILNLKPLNEFIEYKKFKMPTISNVTCMIRRSYKMISVDI